MGYGTAHGFRDTVDSRAAGQKGMGLGVARIILGPTAGGWVELQWPQLWVATNRKAAGPIFYQVEAAVDDADEA